jgi:hypothetical protein
MKHLTIAEATQFARHRGTWLIPTVFMLTLAVVFPAIYLSATSDPQDNLRDLPVGIVSEAQADGAAAPSAMLTAAIHKSVNADAIHLMDMTTTELARRMKTDDIAGAIVIPAAFDDDVRALASGDPGISEVPLVQIRTNSGDGGISSGLVSANLNPVLAGVRSSFGATLLDARQRLAAPVSGAERILLASPYGIQVTPYKALPANAGFGTSAFYYTLVLMLLGFVGASVVNPTVDSALGFAPTEVGPLVSRRPYLHLTRLQTFFVKVVIMTGIAPLAAGLTQLVVIYGVGIEISDPWMLWLFASASVAAVGCGALAVFAAFGGGVGSLVNTIFFIALSMTSSGGTVPLAATPPLFQWLSNITPFHGVLGAVRSILFFDGDAAAGLSEGWIRLAVGAVLGLTTGVVVTAAYAKQPLFARHPHTRHPAHAEVSS